MKTAVPDPNLQQKYTTYLIFGMGLVFMGMAFVLLLVMFVRPQPETAVLATPNPTAEMLHITKDPVQTAVAQNEAVLTWQRQNYNWKLTPRAKFQVEGRVLSRQTYNHDWKAEISPLDLAMGWGTLSDAKVDEWIRWSQAGRWYFYRWPDEAPFEEQYLRTHSSNIHIIPATESLKAALLKIREDDKILLEGKLVDVEASSSDQNWQTQTSLTREDSGSGACEILLVERLIWNGQEYH